MVPDDSSIWLYSATRYTCYYKVSQGTKENIRQVKSRLRRKQKVSAGKFSMELGISATSVGQILKIDLGFQSYEKIIANHHFPMIKRSNGNSLQTLLEQISEKKAP